MELMSFPRQWHIDLEILNLGVKFQNVISTKRPRRCRAAFFYVLEFQQFEKDKVQHIGANKVLRILWTHALKKGDW